jgi:hypothetical protein
MSYEPSGDTRLEGDEILRRLACYLGVNLVELKEALIVIAKSEVIKTIHKENNNVK